MTKRKDPKDFVKRGRPTKYHPGLCKDLVDFFNRPLYIERKITQVVDGKKKISTEQVPNKLLFSLIGL